MKHFMTCATLLLAYSLLNATPARAAPGGELDATFGVNGRVVFDSLFAEGYGFAGAQQADGKLIIVGSGLAAGEPFDAAVLRLNVDGTLDPTFGSDGVALIDISLGYDDGYAMLLQPDGKIVVAGAAEPISENFDLAIARLNADGSADATFGIDGMTVLDLGGNNEVALGIALVEDGKLVVAGFSNANTDFDVAFARFNADGTLDTTFGTSGSVLVDANGENNLAHSLTQQADGKLIACGSILPSPQDFLVGDMMAVRINANGTVDTSFGVAGFAIIDTGTTIGESATCAALPDGTLVLAGASGSSDNADLALARLTSTGILDQSFGAGGQASADLGRFEMVEDMRLLSDGKLGVVGLIEDNDGTGPHDTFIARFNANGSLDTTFGNNGATIADFGNGGLSAESEGFEIVEQADGKLVAIGWANNNNVRGFAIARVNSGGVGNVGVVGFVETTTLVIGEGVGNAVLTVRRTGGSVGAVTVDVSYTNDSAQSDDYRGIDTTVNWADGDTADKTITIQIENDGSDEIDESFRVSLVNSSTVGLTLAATTQGVTILDNDSSGGGGGGGGGGGAFGAWSLAFLYGFIFARQHATEAQATWRKRECRFALEHRPRAGVSVSGATVAVCGGGWQVIAKSGPQFEPMHQVTSGRLRRSMT